MIKLTYMESPVYINPDKIIAIIEEGKDSSIVFTGEEQHFGADQSPEEVTRKILDYKFKRDRQRALSIRWANEEESNLMTVTYQLEDWERSIERLAGLEDKADE